MSILEIIFGIFAVLGAVDFITGNHLKIGKEFEKGIISAGTLAVAMVGMITLSPVIGSVLAPLLKPIAELLHIDLSFVAGFIANDMGGASIAKELAQSSHWGGYNGLVVASMMGVTICFTIPVALKTIDVKYHTEVLNGILCGIATIPIGCIVSGLFLKFSFFELILNLIPVIFVSLATCVGLILNPQLSRKVFSIIGNIIVSVIILGLGIGVFTHITGFTIIPNLEPVSTGFDTVCNIAIILSGVFPLILVMSKLLKRALIKLGSLIKINENSVLGLVASLANSLAAFDLVEKMDKKGIVMNLAFAVSASFVFGDHLAFTMTFDKTFLTAMIIGKLAGGIAALVAAHFLYELKK